MSRNQNVGRHMKDGKYSNIPIEEYHADDSISNSGLSVLAQKTPAHYKRYRDGKIKRKTKSLTFGKDLHCMMLEPDVFKKTYAIGPEVRKNTIIWKNFAAENEGKSLLKQSEHEHLKGLESQVLESCQAVKWFFSQPGESEVSYFWTDHETGIKCRCRADRIIDMGDYVIVGDLKTARDASYNGFSKAISDHGYHRQDAFYSSGIEIIEGKPAKFIFPVVESDSLIFALYELSPHDKEDGRQEVGFLLRTIKECDDSGVWPGYSDKIQTISRRYR